jgi:hypothetical protein
MPTIHRPPPPFNATRLRAAIVAIALSLGSGLAAAVPPGSSRLADGEGDAPKRPRDGGTAPEKADAGTPPEKSDAGTPPEKPDAGDAPPRDPDAGEGPPENPECVHVRTEARYVAYGYDHIVEIENTCEKAMRCTVMTDVNPEIAIVSVAVGQTRSITTFRGSPSREFKATVACAEDEDAGVE